MMGSKPVKKVKKSLDIALFICVVIGVVFTITMICLFIMFQSVPDSLVVAVFAAIFGECGFCSAIVRQKIKGNVKDESRNNSNFG